MTNHYSTTWVFQVLKYFGRGKGAAGSVNFDDFTPNDLMAPNFTHFYSKYGNKARVKLV